MRIAIAGKGGVGKTTVAALLCWALRDSGASVLAVDADPDSNLGRVLGFPGVQGIVPIIQMKEMIEERMGAKKGSAGLFKLNPQIDDIPEKFMRLHDGIKLVVMGSVESGGAGCACAENTFLRLLLHELVLREGEHIVVDFEAGLEHLGRGTASRFDHLLIVVEPTLLSIESAKRICPLGKDIGIKNMWLVVNRVRTERDTHFVTSHIGRVRLLGSFSYSVACGQAHQTGNWKRLKEDKVYREAKKMLKSLLKS